MMNISHEQLNWVLTEGKVTPNKEVLARCKGGMETWSQVAVERMARRLPEIAHRDRVRQAERQQVPHKDDLLEATSKIREAADIILQEFDNGGAPLELALSAFKSDIISQIEAVGLLHNIAEQARFYLEFEADRHSRQEIMTDLYLDIFDLYYEITSRRGNSNNGPLYHFVKGCVALLYPDLKFLGSGAFRGRLMAADKRRREELTCKDVVEISPLDLHL